MQKYNTPPFFIVGSERSGTTLLVQLLNRHSKIFIPPETEFFHALSIIQNKLNLAENSDGIKEFAAHYKKWPAVSFLDIDTEKFNNVILKNAVKFTDVFINMMDYFLKKSAKNHWGEKTPLHLQYIDEISALIPEAKIICMVRDGRAVVKSRIKHPIWNDNLISASLKWKKDIRLCQDLTNKLNSSQLKIIHYEELLTNTENELKELLCFLGEQYEPSIMDKYEKKIEFNDYYTQPWMLKSTSEIDSNHGSAWRDEYTLNELSIVEYLINNELSEMGYLCSAMGRGYWNWGCLFIRESFYFIFNKINKKLNRLKSREF